MTKISALTSLTGAGVDQANDVLVIVDTSAGADKKITVAQLLGLVTDIAGLLDLKGVTDCSGNPNYPAASKGDYYLVSVTGKIGGASGIDVTAGDTFFALADNAGGTQAGVGSSWTVIQGNITYVPVNKAGDTMTGDLVVPDEAYDATNWNGSLEVPTKNAVRDKIEAMGGGSFTAASTTEQLTGTDSSKGSTPDSVAALWEQGSDVASAGTISLGEGGYFFVTGTTTITDIDFATDKAGRTAWVKFAGILTLTHNASTLILPGGANITTAAGDTACFVSEGSDVVRCVNYTKAAGAPVGQVSGTWTPAVKFGGASVGLTYTTQVGRYVRIGDMVLATCHIVINAKGSSTGAFTISGLPFTTKNVSNYSQAGCVGYGGFAAGKSYGVLVDPNTTSLKFIDVNNNALADDGDVNPGGEYIVSITYESEP